MKPIQPWPPALIFTCPDCGPDIRAWRWYANDARGYQARLDKAFARHRREVHDRVGQTGEQTGEAIQGRLL